MKKLLLIIATSMLCLALAACNGGEVDPPVDEDQDPANEPASVMLAAAASLENAFVNDLIPLFQEQYDYITVTGTYDASGKLQTQIEEGLAADVFMSAATKQMDALLDQNLIDPDSVVNLLENKIVLIAPIDSELDITSFEDIVKADTIALGDPESVPAGQYAKEALENLSLYDEVYTKTVSEGTNVTEVLNWVAEGSADVGIVYATDAASMADKVKVIAEAPEGSLATAVIYPVGLVANSPNTEAGLAAAKLFVEFLQSDAAIAIFEQYGFVAAQ